MSRRNYSIYGYDSALPYHLSLVVESYLRSTLKKKEITMIRILVMLMLCLPFTMDVSAQKCKYSLDKNDPMTDERVRRAENKLKNFFIVSYYRKGDTIRVELNVRFVGERNFKVPAGEKMDLKLTGGEMLTLYNSQEASPVSYVSSSQVLTNYGISYYCSKEQMQQLAKAGFKAASAKVGDETLTMEVKEKEIEKTGQRASCILQD